MTAAEKDEQANLLAAYERSVLQWNEHFIWSVNCTEILGLTVIGRATIAKLDLNRPRILSIRLADVAVGRHPPQDDPKMKE